MNFKTTFVLLVLAGAVAALFWKGPELAPRVGLAPKPTLVADQGQGSVNELAKLGEHPITHVEIQIEKTAPLVLDASGAGKELGLPNNWPVRRFEIQELVHGLTHLKSRFHPIPIDSETDLKPFGLDPKQNPIRAEVIAGETRYKLVFGEGKLKAGENPFQRPMYVRVNEKNEILRLGPDIAAVLRRVEEAYRRRQIFPEVDRLRIGENTPGRAGSSVTPPVMLLGDQVKQITIDGPDGRYVLERIAPTPQPVIQPDKPTTELQVTPDQLASAWAIVEPVHDRVDPAKLRALLTTLPNLMVEKFVDNQPAVAAAVGEAGVTALISPSNSTRVTVTLANGDTRTLTLGGISRSTERVEREPPMFQGQPPQQRIVREAYRYGKLGDNSLVFEIKDDKLNDVLLESSGETSGRPGHALAQLRDSQLARFDDSRVTGIEIKSKDPQARPIKLTKTGDEWKMEQPIADAADGAQVTKLVNLIKNMSARDRDVVDRADIAFPVMMALSGPDVLNAALTCVCVPADPLAEFGWKTEQMSKVTLDFDPKSGLQPATYFVGARNPSTNKRAVIVDGRKRINLVDDSVGKDEVSPLDKQASGFRSLKLFDPNSFKISDVIVKRPEIDKRPPESFTVQAESGPTPKWSLVAPFKATLDGTVSSALGAELSKLATRTYVADPATDAAGAKTDFGFDRSRLTLELVPEPEIKPLDISMGCLNFTFSFAGLKKGPEIEIGGERSPTEFYARLKGATATFLVPASLVKALDQPALDLVDKTLIHSAVTLEEVQAIRRTVNGELFEIVQNNKGEWEITKPAPVKVDPTAVDDFIKELIKFHAARIAAVNPANLKEFGLAPPVGTITVEALERGKLVEKVLSIGNPVDAAKPAGDRFVSAPGSTTVGVVAGNLAEKLVAESGAFRKRALWDPLQPKQMKEVSVKAAAGGNDSFSIVSGPVGWFDPENPTERLHSEIVYDLLVALGSLRVDQYISAKVTDLPKYGLDKPRTVTLTTDDGKRYTVLLGNLFEGKRLYAKLNDPNHPDVFLLDEAASRALNRPRADYALIPKKEEPKKEPMKEEPKKDAPKKDESKKAEPKKDDFKKSPEVKKETDFKKNDKE